MVDSMQVAPRMTFSPGPTYDASGAETDAQLVRLWLQGRPQSTQRVYLAAYHSLPPIGLQRLTLSDLVAWVESLGGSPAYRANRIRCVQSLLTFAHRVGYILVNVGAALRPPKIVTDPRARYLTEDEVRRLLDAAGKRRLLFATLYATGCRLDEVLGARWQSLQDGVLGVVGKGARVRHVRIPSALSEALEALRAHPGAPIFATRTGAPLDQGNVRRWLTAAARKASIDKRVSPHWLRHAHASHALTRGAPIHLVQATLGHKSLASTSIYVHANPDQSSGAFLAL